MLVRYAIPCLASRENAVIVSENLHVFGMGEGSVAELIDDLTKETVAAAAEKKLVLHEESLRRIEEYFKGRLWGESQKKQAWLPEGCTVLPNDVGTAPGCVFETETGKIVVMLPGPPSELTPMAWFRQSCSAIFTALLVSVAPDTPSISALWASMI